MATAAPPERKRECCGRSRSERHHVDRIDDHKLIVVVVVIVRRLEIEPQQECHVISQRDCARVVVVVSENDASVRCAQQHDAVRRTYDAPLSHLRSRSRFEMRIERRVASAHIDKRVLRAIVAQLVDSAAIVRPVICFSFVFFVFC